LTAMLASMTKVFTAPRVLAEGELPTAFVSGAL